MEIGPEKQCMATSILQMEISEVKKFDFLLILPTILNSDNTYILRIG